MHNFMAFVLESTGASSSDGIEGVGRRRRDAVRILSSLAINRREIRDLVNLGGGESGIWAMEQ
jgi:hypothetical protein